MRHGARLGGQDVGSLHAAEGENSDAGKQSLPKTSHKNPSVWAGGSGRPPAAVSGGHHDLATVRPFQDLSGIVRHPELDRVSRDVIVNDTGSWQGAAFRRRATGNR